MVKNEMSNSEKQDPCGHVAQLRLTKNKSILRGRLTPGKKNYMGPYSQGYMHNLACLN